MENKIVAYERSSENIQKVNKLKEYARALGLRPYHILLAWKEENMDICTQENIYGFFLSLEWDREHGCIMELRSYKAPEEENEKLKYANSFVNKPQD